MTVSQTITHTELVDGLLAEYAAYADLLAQLSADELTAPTRCDGWQVRDVIAHVVGLAADSFNGRIGKFTPDEQVDQRRGASTQELASELDQAVGVARALLPAITEEQWEGPSGAPDLTLAEGVEALWYDGWVHRDDIHAALGRPRPDDPGLSVSLRHVRLLLDRRGWRPPARVDLDAVDPYRFVLAATGRIPAAELGLLDDVNLYA